MPSHNATKFLQYGVIAGCFQAASSLTGLGLGIGKGGQPWSSMLATYHITEGDEVST